ncbi:VOC family protein [Phenylobacterium sp.]|uniref:VOC family protein n=1 Tax=Phenylobacterium sp. TaxID=1871053 RepID=UPI002899FDA1|nr:VOC family protein [Phenylobacterium sp.]
MSDRASPPSISPVIWYRDPRAAIAWLEKAFGFETRLVVDDGAGGVIHSELALGRDIIMIVGPPRERAVSPASFGGRATQSVHVQLAEGLDALCERARACGASIEREPQDQPYGDRVFTCRDLEDHPWSFGQTVQVMSVQDMAQATGHKIEV